MRCGSLFYFFIYKNSNNKEKLAYIKRIDETFINKNCAFGSYCLASPLSRDQPPPLSTPPPPRLKISSRGYDDGTPQNYLHFPVLH